MMNVWRRGGSALGRNATAAAASATPSSFSRRATATLTAPTQPAARTSLAMPLRWCSTSSPAASRQEKLWGGMVADCVQLPCTLAYTPLPDADLPSRKKVAVVGTKASLEAFAKSGTLPEAAAAALELMLPKLKPKAAKLASMSQLLPPGSGIEEVVVGAVSEEASRHMSPHRGDQVSAFVKRVDAKADASLILAVPSEEALLSYTNAAARAHSLCQLKGEDDGFKAKDREALVTAAWVAGDGVQPTEGSLNQAQIVAESIQLAARLVDAPANYLTTTSYAQIAVGLAERFGFSCEVLRGDALQEQGLEVMHAVGRAAEHEPTLVVMSHSPEKPASEETLCWAGKGVVYDTGGLSLKPSDAMKGMKRDMGGSAGVLGAFVAAVRLGVPVKVHALLGLVENAIGPDAFRNDDVVRCLSGKTIEITNTDAEGRLVLVDVVAYAHKMFDPTVVIDMATLTGASGFATGKHFGAVCSNDEELERSALQAGRDTGDQVFPVVYAPEVLMPEYDSKIADVTNNVGNRANAQVSCAGIFIHDVGFAGKFKGKWLHIDMAYPVEVEGRGTGWGVALLLKLANAL